MRNAVAKIDETPTGKREPRPGDIYYDHTAGLFYLCAQTKSHPRGVGGVMRLFALDSGSIYSDSHIFEGDEDDFTLLPPGTKVEIVVGEGSMSTAGLIAALDLEFEEEPEAVELGRVRPGRKPGSDHFVYPEDSGGLHVPTPSEALEIAARSNAVGRIPKYGMSTADFRKILTEERRKLWKGEE